MRAIEFRLPNALPGLVLCVVATVAAWLLTKEGHLSQYGLGWFPVALIVGMAIGNTVNVNTPRFHEGIHISRGTLLRAGIALFALRLELGDVLNAGFYGVFESAFMVATTLTLSLWLGKRLGLSRNLSLLVGTGSAICGAAAVAAADGAIKSKTEHTAAAIAVVVLFGTVGMFVLPYAATWMNMTALQAGTWFGLSIHELGHVMGAAQMIGHGASNPALLEKMLRVACLVPTVLWIAHRFKGDHSHEGAESEAIKTPMFLWVFVALAAVKFSGVLPHAVESTLLQLGGLLLAIGLCALGINTRFEDLRKVGLKVWVLAIGLWAWLLVASLSLVHANGLGAALLQFGQSALKHFS